MLWVRNLHRNSFPERRKYAMISLACVAGFRAQALCFGGVAVRRMVSNFLSRPQSLAIDTLNTLVRL